MNLRIVRLVFLLQLLLIFPSSASLPRPLVPFRSRPSTRAATSIRPRHPPRKASSDRTLHLHVGLKIPSEQLSHAARLTEDVSGPKSARYGQWLSASEVDGLFSPPKEDVKAVGQWLASAGIPRREIRLSPDRGHILFNAKAGQAEALLGTEILDFGDGEPLQFAADTYYLPQPMAEKIDFINPAELLPTARQVRHAPISDHGPGTASQSVPASAAAAPDSLSKRQSNSTARQVNCHIWASPDCLRHLYGFPALDALEPIHPESSFGVFLPAMATWLSEDLEAFFTQFQPEIIPEQPEVLDINGGYRQTIYQGPLFNMEANLDHEYTMALTYPQTVTNIQVGDGLIGGNLNTMLAAFSGEYCEGGLDPEYDPVYPNPLEGGYNGSDCGVYEPPKVITTSYGWNEASFPEGYLVRQCQEYMKLALRGVTVVAASGDTGTVDEFGQCRDPDTGELREGDGHFSVLFPCSCPYVVCVGGTQLSPTNRAWNASEPWFPPETALFVDMDGRIVNSGGGFSTVFEALPFQVPHMARYLAADSHVDGLTAAGYFNPQGRGYPDVSVRANDFLVQTNGGLRRVTGTSASAPIFASMLARVNNARLLVGKSTVGFANPVLYGFKDEIMAPIETGYNFGCGVDKAFTAMSGWDAVTGLGSPQFQKLVDVFLALP